MGTVKAAKRRGRIIAAARTVAARGGIEHMTLRGVAAEADMALATLQYTFPSKELILEAVVVDVVEEVGDILRAAGDVGHGLGHALRHGLGAYWRRLVVDDPSLALLHHELFVYCIRTPGLQHLARRQVDGYARIVAWWSQEAAHNAGEACAVPFDALGRLVVGSMIGLVLDYLSNEDVRRSREDLDSLVVMVCGLAGVAPGR